MSKTLYTALLSLLLLSSASRGQPLEVFTDLSLPQADLVVRELETAIEKRIQCHAVFEGIADLNQIEEIYQFREKPEPSKPPAYS